MVFSGGGGGRNLTDNRLASPVVDATVSRTLDPPLFLPPANEVCEGYVFTGVCLSIEGSLSRGYLFRRGLCLGGLCPRRVSVHGGSLSRGISVQGGVTV